MHISFAPLATVSITHTYYGAGCRDIDFLPSSGTSEMLRAGRMLARMLDGQLHLLYEAESKGVPISSLAGKTLHFGLRLNNPMFDNITAPAITDVALQPLYANVTTPTILDAPHGVSVVAGLHTHIPSLATRPVTLRLEGATPAATTLDTRMLDEEATSYDLRGLLAGEYRIEEDYGGGVLRTRPLFVDVDLRDAGVWGVLSLHIDADFYVNAAKFSMSFQAREETLRYYVVGDNWAPEDFDLINVVDEGAAAAGRTPIVFTKSAPPFPDDFIPSSLLGDSSAQIAVFQSQTKVPRQERGLRKLHLNRSTTVLIEHLPLPGPERAKADLIVHLSKP